MFLGHESGFVTLDDDIFGKNARDIQLETLGTQKEDWEGHMADVYSDAMVHGVLQARFKRGVEKLEESVVRVDKVVAEGKEGSEFIGMIMTMERGYKEIEAIKKIIELDVSVLEVLEDR